MSPIGVDECMRNEAMIFHACIDHERLEQQIGIKVPIAERCDRYRCGNDNDDQGDRDGQNSELCAEDIRSGSICMIPYDPPTLFLLGPKQGETSS